MFSPMANSENVSVVAAFHLVRVEVLAHLAYWCPAECPLHSANAGAAEIQKHTTMSVMLLLTKLVQPLINKRRDTALLSTHRCVDAPVHDCLRSACGCPNSS